MSRTQIGVALASILVVGVAEAQERNDRRGQLGAEWSIDAWMQLPKGKRTLRRADFAGKVLYIYCFQAWCPACHSHGFPLLKKLVAHYANNRDVAFLAVQTVFEGFRSNTKARVKRIAKRYDLAIPFAHDPGADGGGAELMATYGTGGTPWSILMDRNGVIRQDGFSSHSSFEEEKKAIDALLAEKAIVGRAFGKTDALGLDGAPPPSFARKKLTMVYWRSAAGANGEDTLGALVDLRDRYKDAGLELLAIVDVGRDGKPKAEDLELLGQLRVPVGIDAKRAKLRSLSGTRRRKRGAVLLVDPAGRIVWFHPGPRLFPAESRRDWWANREWQQLEALVRKRLRAKPGK